MCRLQFTFILYVLHSFHKFEINSGSTPSFWKHTVSTPALSIRPKNTQFIIIIKMLGQTTETDCFWFILLQIVFWCITNPTCLGNIRGLRFKLSLIQTTILSEFWRAATCSLLLLKWFRIEFYIFKVKYHSN